MWLLERKSPWLFVRVCCECMCCWDHLCEFAVARQVSMPLPETLCECYVCVSVWCVSEAHCARMQEKTTGVCVCLLCCCVLWRAHLSVCMVVRSVDASAGDLV